MPQGSALPSFPVPAEKYALAHQLVRELDAPALNWLSGFLAGAAAHSQALAASQQPAAASSVAADSLRLTVLYGSQTGNAKRVAETLAAAAAGAGIDVRLLRADAYPLHELKQERCLYVVISTHSVGDELQPPDDARAFMEFLTGRRAPRLPELQYAVLALGDTSYAEFCGIGRRIDERLAELGGKRLFERGEADADVDTVAEPWSARALDEARKLHRPAQPAVRVAGDARVTPLRPAHPAWTRLRPFAADVLANQRIVANDSGKEVRHIELSLAESGLNYQPGDALGVWPTQRPELVDAVLRALRLDGDTEVTVRDDTLPLARWLGERRELTTVTRPFLAVLARRSASAELEALLAPDRRAQLAALLDRTQLPDWLHAYPAPFDAQALVEALRPLAPRSYSIASSQSQVEDEVHLTVALVHYRASDAERYGVASRFLIDQEEGARVRVFIDANDRFRLPADPSRDIIMIGPGTGVAPFRAFLQQRTVEGARGRNWLFFGNPHRRTDFLYQLEWQQARKNGVLTHLDVAFSRDQDHAIHVQHRIAERGRELWGWLSNGACVYVCGDADHMAPDVDAALAQLAVKHGGKRRTEAVQWLQGLMTEGRYARDVY